jgi:hypothetical protein
VIDPIEKGGGVFIAVKTHLHSTVHALNGNDIESVWCTIRQINGTYIHAHFIDHLIPK